MTTTVTSDARIAVTNLAAYNNGDLIFEWVDVDTLVGESISDLLEEWGVEEWFASDSEGVPSSFGEYPSIEDLCAYGEALEGQLFRDDPATVLAAYVDEYGIDELDSLDDRDCGEWTSFEEYAEQLFDEVYFEVVKAADECSYLTVDYAGFARDLAMDGYTSIGIAGGVRIFRDDA